MSTRGIQEGMTIVELMLGVGVLVVVIGLAVPFLRAGREQAEVAAAVRYLSGRVMLAHSRAVKRGVAVGMRFERAGDAYRVRSYQDGDGDGVLTTDIAAGVDPPVEASWRLRDRFPSARFIRHPSVPLVGEADVSYREADPIKLGRTNILTFSPPGTASSGTLYIGGPTRQEQYALRILGATSRVRILRFDSITGSWDEA